MRPFTCGTCKNQRNHGSQYPCNICVNNNKWVDENTKEQIGQILKDTKEGIKR